MLSLLFSDPLMFFTYIISILIALTVHEMAHGYTAYWLGDRTAKEQGRLSFNPLRHVDPLGFAAMVIVGFGWAKPVMMNPYNFKNFKDGIAITAFAGPFSNFMLGTIGLLLVKLFTVVPVPSIVSGILMVFASVNFMLAALNILPLPILDGFKVVMRILPDSIYDKAFEIERRFGVIILIILVFSGILRMIWLPVYNFLVIIGSKIAFLPPEAAQYFIK